LKLTNYMRDAFVRAVMDDVPEVDYKQQIRDTALKAAVEAMPAKLRTVWDDPKLQDCIAVGHTYLTDCVYKNLPVYPGIEEALKAQTDVLEALHAKHHAQEDQRYELRTKVKAVAYSAKTRKQLAEMLPEFEKYLPADEAAAIRTLPVVANVVAELVAAGWPKEQMA
jgi:hypothetical protein